MEAGNGVGLGMLCGDMDKAPIGSDVNTETEIVGAGFCQEITALVGNEAVEQVPAALSEQILPNDSKKAAPDRLVASKSMKGHKERGAWIGGSAGNEQNQKARLSRSISFTSKGGMSNGLRKCTTFVKSSLNGSDAGGPESLNGALPFKKSNSSVLPSTRRSAPAKAGSVDLNDVPSEAIQNSTATGQHKIGATGFGFRLVERAEKRKEFYHKLEEKIQAKEVEKTSLQEKSKENQEAEIRQLRKSLTFRATPMPSFYQESGPPKMELKKIPPTRAKSPKLGRHKTMAPSADDSSEHSIAAYGSSHAAADSNDKPIGSAKDAVASGKKPLQRSLSKQSQKSSTSSKPEVPRVANAKLPRKKASTQTVDKLEEERAFVEVEGEENAISTEAQPSMTASDRTDATLLSNA